MSSPLAALYRRYNLEQRWAAELPRLGGRGAVRGGATAAMLPAPELEELVTRTKFPHVLGVLVGGKLAPLKSPCSPGSGHRLTRHLVEAGVHPRDIIIATWGGGDAWTFRDAVEWLYWTQADQRRMEEQEAA